MTTIRHDTRTRRVWVLMAAAALLVGSAVPAGARAKTGAELRCYQQDGVTVSTCFTAGPSADGGGKSITLDGRTENPTATSSVAFRNWWNQTLESVQQLKISTQNPVTAGSPRISILLEDAVDDADTNGHTLFLSPFYCASSNANGWRSSNWRGDPSCVIYDETGTGYAGWDAYTAAHPGQRIWFAFVIQDEPQLSRVDRIQLDAQLFTK